MTHSGAVAPLPSHSAESTSTQCLLPPRLCWEHPGSRIAGNVPVNNDVRSPNTLHMEGVGIDVIICCEERAITAWPRAQPLYGRRGPGTASVLLLRNQELKLCRDKRVTLM